MEPAPNPYRRQEHGDLRNTSVRDTADTVQRDFYMPTILNAGHSLPEQKIRYIGLSCFVNLVLATRESHHHPPFGLHQTSLLKKLRYGYVLVAASRGGGRLNTSLV